MRFPTIAAGAARRFLLAGVLLAVAACSSSEKGEDLNVVIPKLIDKLKGPSAVDEAANLFNADNPDARRIAVAYLSTKKWGHEPPYMKAYHVLATSDPDPMVRGQALRALGTAYRPEVAPDLIAGLAHENPIVRRDAAAAIDNITSESVVVPLLEHLRDDPDAQVRVNCARALDKYRRPEVIRALVQALDDKDVAVGHRAWLTLQALTGQTFPAEPAAWADYVQTRYPATQPG